MTATDLSQLLPIAIEMTSSLSGERRAQRLIDVVKRAMPCDSAALLKLRDGELFPVATFGFSEDIEGRVFQLGEHPRLDIIRASETPVRFPADSALPDPYDGLVIGEGVTLDGQVHSCLGCALRVEGELVGVLTADALRPGAFDGLDDVFLTYLAALSAATLRTNELLEALERRAEHGGMVAAGLVEDAMQKEGATLVGGSESLAGLRKEISLVAPAEFPVLVTGETGVGKELCVRMLHAQSARRAQPLIYLNCAALPESIVESELFGHVRGAFTGAEEDRLGKFRLADGASLFLDEVGELPLHVQPKLLRVLQQGEIQRVGSDEVGRVDVRVFAATNRDLEDEVARGRFRADLLHRLDVCRIHVPPLRERRADIPALAGHFADRVRARLGTGPIRFAPDAQALLMGGRWRGNARELENVVARGALRAAGRVGRGEAVRLEAGDIDVDLPGGEGLPPGAAAASLRPAPIPAREPSAQAPGPSLRESVDGYQRSLIQAAIDASAGNWAQAARTLGVERGNLHRLASRLGLK